MENDDVRFIQNYTNIINQLFYLLKYLNWKCKFYDSKWIKEETAGGSKEEKYWSNPRFLVSLKEIDTYDNKCALVIALMQKNNKYFTTAEKYYYLQWNYQILSEF